MANPDSQSTHAAGRAPEPRGPAPIVLRPLTLSEPFGWLRAGARDMAATPFIALFYGLCFWAMALLLGWVFRARPQYTMSLASGCLLVGPFLAMGLYETSRRREAGLDPGLEHSLLCWDKHMGSMGMLVLVLIVLELLWGRASLVVFAVFFNTGMPSTSSVLQAVFSPQNWSFLAVYLVVGGAFAALVFASTVVSIPMILDRDTDAITAGITSMRVVAERTAVMLLWGLLIALLVGVALWPWGSGLVIVGPWLGHASWHAYRGAIEPLEEPLQSAEP